MIIKKKTGNSIRLNSNCLSHEHLQEKIEKYITENPDVNQKCIRRNIKPKAYDQMYSTENAKIKPNKSSAKKEKAENKINVGSAKGNPRAPLEIPTTNNTELKHINQFMPDESARKKNDYQHANLYKSEINNPTPAMKESKDLIIKEEAKTKSSMTSVLSNTTQPLVVQSTAPSILLQNSNFPGPHPLKSSAIKESGKISPNLSKGIPPSINIESILGTSSGRSSNIPPNIESSIPPPIANIPIPADLSNQSSNIPPKIQSSIPPPIGNILFPAGPSNQSSNIAPKIQSSFPPRIDNIPFPAESSNQSSNIPPKVQSSFPPPIANKSLPADLSNQSSNIPPKIQSSILPIPNIPLSADLSNQSSNFPPKIQSSISPTISNASPNIQNSIPQPIISTPFSENSSNQFNSIAPNIQSSNFQSITNRPFFMDSLGQPNSIPPPIIFNQNPEYQPEVASNPLNSIPPPASYALNPMISSERAPDFPSSIPPPINDNSFGIISPNEGSNKMQFNPDQYSTLPPPIPKMFSSDKSDNIPPVIPQIYSIPQPVFNPPLEEQHDYVYDPPLEEKHDYIDQQEYRKSFVDDYINSDERYQENYNREIAENHDPRIPQDCQDENIIAYNQGYGINQIHQYYQEENKHNQEYAINPEQAEYYGNEESYQEENKYNYNQEHVLNPGQAEYNREMDFDVSQYWVCYGCNRYVSNAYGYCSECGQNRA